MRTDSTLPRCTAKLVQHPDGVSRSSTKAACTPTPPPGSPPWVLVIDVESIYEAHGHPRLTATSPPREGSETMRARPVQHWNPPSSRTLQPGEEAGYALRLVLTDGGPRGRTDALLREGQPAVHRCRLRSVVSFVPADYYHRRGDSIWRPCVPRVHACAGRPRCRPTRYGPAPPPWHTYTRLVRRHPEAKRACGYVAPSRRMPQVAVAQRTHLRRPPMHLIVLRFVITVLHARRHAHGSRRRRSLPERSAACRATSCPPTCATRSCW